MACGKTFSLAKYLDGFSRFRNGYYRENAALLSELMARPQNPRTLMIACADSRIDPSFKFGTAPGEMFTVRNIASLVPPYTADGVHHGTSAAVEFAVRTLKVEDIVVLGHARCGGVQHLLSKTGDHEFVSPWMELAGEARRRIRRAKGDEAQRICEYEAIKISLRNLLTFPWVNDAVEKGRLKIHGWHVDLGTGRLDILDDTGAFVTAIPAPHAAPHANANQKDGNDG